MSHSMRPRVAILSPNIKVHEGKLVSANASTWIRLAERCVNMHARPIEYDFLLFTPGWKDTLLSYQAVIIQRTALLGKDYRELIDFCKKHSIPLIYEIDDDLIAIASGNGDSPYTGSREHIETMLSESSQVTVSTEPLLQRYRSLNKRIQVVPNFISERIWLTPPFVPARKSPIAQIKGRELRAVYFGSATHADDLMLLEEPIRRLNRGTSKLVSLFVIGVSDLRSDWFQRIDIPADSRNYPNFVKWIRPILRDMDIGLAPLQDTYFNAAKSDLKLMEYAAAGIPCLASNVPAYSQNPTQSVTPLLADNTVDSWEESLAQAAQDNGMLIKLGESNKQKLGCRLMSQHINSFDSMILETLL